MPTHTTHRRLGLRLRAVALLALAALAAAFAFAPRDAHAQDLSYVDLSIKITVGTTFSFTARNHGTAIAYGVTVDIELADQNNLSPDRPQFKQNSGTTCSVNIPTATATSTCFSGVWTVGTLKPGEETSFGFHPDLARGLPCCPDINDEWTVPARAVIKNTVPEEEERFKADNTAVGWIVTKPLGNANKEAVGRYWLEASVDDLLPDPGDTVKFSFEFNTVSGLTQLAEVKARLKLDDGMGTPTASTSTLPSGTTFDAAPGLTRTWDWNIGRPTTRGLELEVSTTLDDPLPANVARSDLCLTAELTARPNNIGTVDRVTYTTAEICLREDPTVLLEEGQATLFSIHPCVGVTAYPCSSDDTIEVLAIGDSAARAAGIARDESLLDPDRVFVQVKDPEGRRIDTYSASVNSGTAPSWHTARQAHTNIDSAVDGVDVRYTRGAFTTEQKANYNRLDRTVAVAGLAGATAPGVVKIRYPTSGNAEFEPNPSATREDDSFSVNATKFVRFVEFSTLGTYKIDFTPAVTHTSGTATTTDDVVYSGTGSYIFHVGPVAELEVRDGTAGLAPAGTRAFTVVAVNNGPDDAPAVQVTLTNLIAGDYLSHSATAGAFATSTGVWTIGELREPGYQQAIHGRDGEVLTIITSAAVDTEITAAIENTQDYQVCIDSSGDDVDLTSPSSSACTTEDATNTWHTAKYYDHISDNSTTTIKAKAGTGADLPSVKSPVEDTASIIVEWDAVSEVNGRKVTHYEVQRETNPWITVATTSLDTYVDTDVEEGDTFQYRVRAVNDRGQEGPWSQPMSGTVMVPDIPPPGRPPGLEATPLGTSEILVTWNTPSGAAVSRYELEVSDDGGANWTPLNSNVQGNSYTHSGLQAGDTRHYQVRAWNTDSPAESGDWSATANATTPTDGGTTDTTPRVITRTETEVVTVTVSEAEDPFAYFPSGKVSRSVAENSAPGSPVGAPVAVDRNPGNNVVYSLEGADAALFGIERDTGQILVGRGTMLDFESDRTSYSVEVVAEPSRTGKVRATVDIDVVDVAESASVTITPEGQPQVGEALTATLTHEGGEPVEPCWQWHRSTSGGLWVAIQGAGQAQYTPTERDAGRRLRAIVTFGEPGGDGQGVAGAVTPALAGEIATGPAATYDADGDGRIDADEVLAAIAAYYAG